MADDNERTALPRVEFREFLEKVPPNQECEISDAMERKGSPPWRFIQPRIRVHCVACDGIRSFETHVVNATAFDLGISRSENVGPIVVHCFCVDCREFTKLIAVTVNARLDAKDLPFVTAMKYGEHPPFGDPIPPKVFSLVGPDRTEFLKGRRCEYQGLGIAAFSYYRRVVERQKSRIFDRILEVAKRTNAPLEFIEGIEAAKKKTQFSEAVDQVKPGFPPQLLVDGHNPLKLLHAALSKGMHNDSDEECLQLATDIRIVLFDLVERVEAVTRDEKEIRGALSRLLQPRSPPGS